MRIFMLRIAVIGAMLATLGMMQPANAWWPHHHHPRWYGGFYVAPQPYFYAPPPMIYYAPPPATSGGCYAGPYVCPLQAPAYAGQSCACDTAQGRVWGHAR